MVTIKITDNPKDMIVRLEVSGHAEYAEEGKDIVCSAVSMLTYTVAQLIHEMKSFGKLEKEPTVKMNHGDSVIEAKCRKGVYYFYDAKRIMRYAKSGYRLLQRDYPDHVKLIVNSI